MNSSLINASGIYLNQADRFPQSIAELAIVIPGSPNQFNKGAKDFKWFYTVNPSGY